MKLIYFLFQPVRFFSFIVFKRKSVGFVFWFQVSYLVEDGLVITLGVFFVKTAAVEVEGKLVLYSGFKCHKISQNLNYPEK